MTKIHNNAVANDRRQDFLMTLPFDIVGGIFSHMNKSDCLKCMGVSRKWFDHVPHHAINLWREITISSLGILNNQLILRCLGPHLRKVNLHGMNECEIGMVLRALAQDGPCNTIRSIELFRCTTIDRRNFANALQPVLASLTEIAFRQHRNMIDVLAFLQVCPNTITHLTFHVSTGYRSAQIYNLENTVPPTLALPQLSLTYLNLHTGIPRPSIEHILRHCPRLMCLVLDAMKPYSSSIWSLLESCTTLCPTIQYLAWGPLYPQDISHWKDRVSATTKNRGLREVVSGSFYHSETFTRMLLQHHQTLEVVRLRRMQNDQDPWCPAIDLVAFEQLQTIYVNNIYTDSTALARWISRCPNLQELSLHMTCADIEQWTENICQALPKQSLKHLYLTQGRSICTINGDESPLYNYIAESSLRTISLSGQDMVTDAILEALAKNAATLRHVALHYNSRVTSNGLRAFARNLRWTLDDLQIVEDASVLQDDVLMPLSTKVRRMTLKRCNGITANGLKAFANTARELKRLQIIECVNIDQEPESIDCIKKVLSNVHVYHVPKRNAETVYFSLA
ncbi:hypothetical protein BJV82DRAFT_709080 [Fennellomyces sp. T-0311]|nr:hypothetical protein BJV82DRAFT_709080 [Fennellomyces sp. T-0311]